MELHSPEESGENLEDAIPQVQEPLDGVQVQGLHKSEHCNKFSNDGSPKESHEEFLADLEQVELLVSTEKGGNHKDPAQSGPRKDDEGRFEHQQRGSPQPGPSAHHAEAVKATMEINAAEPSEPSMPMDSSTGLITDEPFGADGALVDYEISESSEDNEDENMEAHSQQAKANPSTQQDQIGRKPSRPRSRQFSSSPATVV